VAEFQKNVSCWPDVCIDILVFLKKKAMWFRKKKKEIGQSDRNCPAVGRETFEFDLNVSGAWAPFILRTGLMGYIYKLMNISVFARMIS
jgi:hypothetical protein